MERSRAYIGIGVFSVCVSFVCLAVKLSLRPSASSWDQPHNPIVAPVELQDAAVSPRWEPRTTADAATRAPRPAASAVAGLSSLAERYRGRSTLLGRTRWLMSQQEISSMFSSKRPREIVNYWTGERQLRCNVNRYGDEYTADFFFGDTGLRLIEVQGGVCDGACNKYREDIAKKLIAELGPPLEKLTWCMGWKKSTSWVSLYCSEDVIHTRFRPPAGDGDVCQ